MALARLCLNRALAAGRTPAFAAAASHGGLNLRSLSSANPIAAGAPSEGEAADCREVAVADHPRRRGRWAWRDLSPFCLVDGLGSAVSQVAETLARPLERLAAAASRRPAGKVRQEEERYRLRFEVPGLGKEDVRVAVEDGSVLVIHGERREAREGEWGDDAGETGEWWSAVYHASLLLPEDARVEGIAAEVKDGVLYVTVPRAPERMRSVTEVKVQ